jgi:hypothetical protein
LRPPPPSVPEVVVPVLPQLEDSSDRSFKGIVSRDE